jgi:hypothetical protein
LGLGFLQICRADGAGVQLKACTACCRQRRRREIFIEQKKKEFQAPAGAASAVQSENVHARKSFREENVGLLGKFGVNYDQRYLFETEEE